MPGRRRPVLAVAGQVPYHASLSPPGLLRSDGFLSLPDLQLVERDGHRYSLGQQGPAEGTAPTATRSDNVMTPSTKTAQSHVVPSPRPRSPPLHVIKRRIPISAPLQLSYLKEETLEDEGGSLAASTKPQALQQQSKRGSRNTGERLKAKLWPTNSANLDAAVPHEVQVLAAQVTASVTCKEDPVQYPPNMSLNLVPSGAECAASATEAAAPAPDYNTGREKITESSQQQVCVLFIEGGAAAWSKRSGVPRTKSRRGENLASDVEAADQASSSNPDKDSASTVAKEERFSESAETGYVKSVPLFVLLGATFMFCFWVMQAMKYEGSSGIVLPPFAAGFGKSHGAADGEGDSMTVPPENDIEVAMRELRGRETEDDQDGHWKRKRIVVAGIPGDESSGEGYTVLADDYLNATAVEPDAAT